MNIEEIGDIIKTAVDIHVHVGPEIIPRKYTAASLAESEKGKLKGAVLKNHFLPTANCLPSRERSGMELYGSVVLNNSVGGLNPNAVYACAYVAPPPLFVWMPTLHTKQFLENSAYEVPPEWVNKKDFSSRPAKNVNPVIVSSDDKLVPEIWPLLSAIKETDSVLCTGHISWRESLMLAKAAVETGIRKIIITHPIYQKIAMPLDAQKELAGMGCIIEHCFSMHSIDKIPIHEIARQIFEVGAEKIALSSDVGQNFSPSPSEALLKFALLLSNEDVEASYIDKMLVKPSSRLFN